MDHSIINHIYDTKEDFLLQDEGRYTLITKEYDSTADIVIGLGRLFLGYLIIKSIYFNSEAHTNLILGAIITAALGCKSFFPSDPIFATYKYGTSFKIDGESIKEKHFYDAFEKEILYKVFFYNRLLDNSNNDYHCKSIDSDDLYDYNPYVESGISKMYNGSINWII